VRPYPEAAIVEVHVRPDDGDRTLAGEDGAAMPGGGDEAISAAGEHLDAADVATLPDAAPEPPGVIAEVDEGPCASDAHIAEERCALADRLRARLEMSRAALREAQRAYDVNDDRIARTTAISDPREIRRAKDDAQVAFRKGRLGARSRGELEEVATTWLHEIDRINRAAATARTELEHERGETGRLVTVLERLTTEADAARISSDRAAEACLEARERLAACMEVQAGGSPIAGLAVFGARRAARAAYESIEVGGEREFEAAVEAGTEPPILALLRSDEATRMRLAATLAGDDEAAVARWSDRLEDLVDAIVDGAMADSRFVFARDDPFWGWFTQEECRDIAVTLAALGYHPDRNGTFVDGRIPTRRDLSLAVGYAGQDPIRIRLWPSEAGLAGLFAGTATNVEAFLIEGAGGLTLGEMVALLGRRAEQLTDLWDEWGRIRPLLLRPEA
jgi:hypothetical protein